MGVRSRHKNSCIADLIHIYICSRFFEKRYAIAWFWSENIFTHFQPGFLCNTWKFHLLKIIIWILLHFRSTISIFPHKTEAKKEFRVWNSQLIRYAGYKQIDGSIVGDPSNVDFTEVRIIFMNFIKVRTSLSFLS